MERVGDPELHGSGALSDGRFEVRGTGHPCVACVFPHRRR